MLPTDGPRITSNKSQHKVGDVVQVNCTSAKSKPGATLRWYIDEIPVDATKVSLENFFGVIWNKEYFVQGDTTSSVKTARDGLETSTLGLKFVLTEHYIRNGMRLKCTASIARMYKLSSELHFDKVVDEKQSASKKKVTISENLSQGKSHHVSWCPGNALIPGLQLKVVADLQESRFIKWLYQSSGSCSSPTFRPSSLQLVPFEWHVKQHSRR